MAGEEIKLNAKAIESFQLDYSLKPTNPLQGRSQMYSRAQLPPPLGRGLSRRTPPRLRSVPGSGQSQSASAA